MKITRISALLLAFNLILAGMILYLLGKRSGVEQVSREPGAQIVTNIVPVNAPTPEAVTSEIKTNDFHWAQLESEDYRTYIARLRSFGCPEQTIRDIIIADLNNLWAPRLSSIVPRRKDLQYWQPEEEEVWNNFDHRAGLKQKREADFEKRDVVQELLGVDLVSEKMRLEGQEDFYGRRLSFLPEAKRAQVRMILEKTSEQELAIREKVWEEGQPLDQADQMDLNRISAAQQQELSALLTPEEQRLYELWLSPTANQIRFAVYGMNATEEEFLKLFALQKAFDEAWDQSKVDLTEDANKARWEEARHALDQEIHLALGDERYSVYERGKDPEYHALNAAVTRFKLPENLANELYGIKRMSLEERARLEANNQLSATQKKETLASMHAEIETALTSLLGDRALHYLRHRGFANWIPAE